MQQTGVSLRSSSTENPGTNTKQINNDDPARYINHNDYIDIQSHPAVNENGLENSNSVGGKTPL